MSTPTDFEQIVRDHQDMVFRTLARLLGHSADLEDLAQEVFLRLYCALPNFRGDSTLATYLYRITLNVAHTESKRRRQPAADPRRHVSLSAPLSAFGEDTFTLEDRLAHPGPTPEQHLDHRQFAAALDRHLAALSHVERSVLVLYHQEACSYEQIAAILQLPLNTVRTHLHRARQRLRAALQQPAPASNPLHSTRAPSPIHGALNVL